MFHMVWTTSWNSRSIGYAHSRDVIHWSAPRKINIWGDFTAVKNTWAPERASSTRWGKAHLGIAARRKRPERFVGMHWSENAHATRFMELIRGEQTSDQILTTVAELAVRLGKEPAVRFSERPWEGR